jgi:hypothetical protein
MCPPSCDAIVAAPSGGVPCPHARHRSPYTRSGKHVDYRRRGGFRFQKAWFLLRRLDRLSHPDCHRSKLLSVALFQHVSIQRVGQLILSQLSTNVNGSLVCTKVILSLVLAKSTYCYAFLAWYAKDTAATCQPLTNSYRNHILHPVSKRRPVRQ